MNAKILLTVAAMAASCFAFAQDTTNVPIQGDTAVNQSSSDSMLQDMEWIPQRQVPMEVMKAIQGNDFKGIKSYFKHKNKDEYAVEVTTGEISSMHFFDKDGKPLNPRKE